MPGTIIFKPVEVSLKLNNHIEPILTFTIGEKHASGPLSNKSDPTHLGYIALEQNNESECLVEVRDKSAEGSGEGLGNVKLDLCEIESRGSVTKWYPLLGNDNIQKGELLLESMFQPKRKGSGGLLDSGSLQKSNSGNWKGNEDLSGTGQPQEQLEKNKQDGDSLHLKRKESGVDLTSDVGPHKGGYDKNLWTPPDNLKDIGK